MRLRVFHTGPATPRFVPTGLCSGSTKKSRMRDPLLQTLRGGGIRNPGSDARIYLAAAEDLNLLARELEQTDPGDDKDRGGRPCPTLPKPILSGKDRKGRRVILDDVPISSLWIKFVSIEPGESLEVLEAARQAKEVALEEARRRGIEPGVVTVRPEDCSFSVVEKNVWRAKIEEGRLSGWGGFPTRAEGEGE